MKKKHSLACASLFALRSIAAELTYVPASERIVAYRKARIWIAIYAAVVLAAIVSRSPAPLIYVFLPYVPN